MVPTKQEASDADEARERSPSNRVRKSAGDPQPTKTVTEINAIPSPESEPDTRGLKRKRVHDADDRTAYAASSYKKSAMSGMTTTYQNNGDNEFPVRDPPPPSATADIDWGEYFGAWPPAKKKESGAIMSQATGNKRSRASSQTSYSQQVREGQSPLQWTRQHELKMQEFGMIMTDYQHRATITDEDRTLCNELGKKEYPLPTDSAFQLTRFSRVLERAMFCNEARVVRDVTPFVCPSAELLHVDQLAELDAVCEALNAEWTRCDTLCGPRPKPDFVAGISASTLTKDEREKLQVSHTSACPNTFPENMYFPFLVCEVKGSSSSIQEAERQAMHSASIAVRAVVQLYRKVDLAEQLNRQILAFSVAHDHATVKMFGHFATIDGENLTFHRHRLHSSEFVVDFDAQRWPRSYHIVRAIYDLFAPKHLARIRHALQLMPSPSTASLPTTTPTQTDEEEAVDGPSQTTAQTSVQDDGMFKKPPLPAMAKLQQEKQQLQDEMMAMMRNHERQMGLERERFERQMEQQRLQMERQMEQQKEIIQLFKERRNEGRD